MRKRTVVLSSLKPGTRFKVPELDDLQATLIAVNTCRAVVKIHKGLTSVYFTDKHGEEHDFLADESKVTSWYPHLMVEPMGDECQKTE